MAECYYGNRVLLCNMESKLESVYLCHFILQKNSYYKILIPVSTLLNDRKSVFFFSFLFYQSQKIIKTEYLMASTVFHFIWKIFLRNSAFPLKHEFFLLISLKNLVWQNAYLYYYQGFFFFLRVYYQGICIR